jgi:polyhydroxybutyrate depolymerase
LIAYRRRVHSALGRVGPIFAILITVLSCLLPGAARAWASPYAAAQLDFGGLPRTYVLHVPPGGHPSALVVNLHGAGATGGGQEALTNYDAVADAHGFAVVYPDGIDLSWADGRGASPSDRRGVDDVGFISSLVVKLVSDLGIAPGRVFATGMSAGGFMANRLACDRADLFAAIAPVAGTLGVAAACNPSRPVAVLLTHGTADGVVPFLGGVMTGLGGESDVLGAPTLVDRWRSIDGCSDAPVQDALGPQTIRVTSSSCAAGTAVQFTRIEGGGHTWPFDASETSAQFFNAHAR